MEQILIESYKPSFLKSKDGKLNEATLQTAIVAIVLLVVLFQLYATLVPEAQAAGDSLNASGVPLGSLFTSNGVVFVIIMAALIIVVIRAFMPGKAGK
jgi:hypothetical protein